MASEKADTWMPLYVTDYLGDTMHLTTEQHGAYMLLLMACWKGDGRLAHDDKALASITRLSLARWKTNKATLLKFFAISDDFITQGRVVVERKKAKEISNKRSNAGKEGAAKRWQTDGNCHSKGMANDCQTPKQTDAPSPSPSKATEANASGTDVPADPIFGSGLAFLIRKGIPAAKARPFLGKLRKQAGDVQAAAILADAESHDVTDPIPWLSRAAMNARAGPNQQPSKTLSAIQQLEAMKNGLADTRDHNRLPETALLELGQDPGE